MGFVILLAPTEALPYVFFVMLSYTFCMTYSTLAHKAHNLASLAIPVGFLEDLAKTYASPQDLPDGVNIQLFPHGSFSARDGRPSSMTKGSLKAWCMNESVGTSLVAAVKARATPLVIDYEHQSRHTVNNGQPAPAAGWIESVVYLDGHGLFAAVTWTERAKVFIEAGEYRYISPVFTFDMQSGAVQSLVSAALTNTPALDGMEAVAATEEDALIMNELLVLLRSMLGLPSNASEVEAIAALQAIQSDLAAYGADVTLCTALAQPDPARFVPMAMLTTLQSANAVLQGKVASLEAQQNSTALSLEIDKALSDGRLLKGDMEKWARSLAVTSPESLRIYLRSATPVAALNTMQTQGHAPQDTQGVGTAALTDGDKYVMNQLGLSAEEYKAAKGLEA